MVNTPWLQTHSTEFQNYHDRSSHVSSSLLNSVKLFFIDSSGSSVLCALMSTEEAVHISSLLFAVSRLYLNSRSSGIAFLFQCFALLALSPMMSVSILKWKQLLSISLIIQVNSGIFSYLAIVY